MLPLFIEWVEGKPIGQIQNAARLMVLNKGTKASPEISGTRPITILSPIRKMIETYLMHQIKDVLWN